jgi:hypothetical protein
VPGQPGRVDGDRAEDVAEDVVGQFGLGVKLLGPGDSPCRPGGVPGCTRRRCPGPRSCK